MKKEDLKQVELYTDGACSGNPGPGGYGAVLKYNEKEKCLSQGYKLTTNNRMEIMGLVVGLESLSEECQVTIYTDSKYVADSITQGWVKKWKANGWRRADKKPAQNVDLWEKLLILLEKHKVKIIWVKGHAGHKYNEICDKLAVEACNSSELIDDEGYKC